MRHSNVIAAGLNVAVDRLRRKRRLGDMGQSLPQTYCFGQRVLVRVVGGRALLDLLQQQRVLDQAAARQIQEVPQVQLAAEGRLLTQAQEVLHALLLLLLVQQGFGPHLVAAVGHIGIQAGELR